LWAIEGLHPIARVVLACGLSVRLAQRIAARASGFRRLVRSSLPILTAIVVLLIVVVGSEVALAERRARALLPRPRPGAPNVLLIVMDNVRVDDLSLYGYRRDTSPNLERLARRAFRFDQARATAPWTLPSHASMFTGCWPHQLSTTVDRPLDATCPILAEFLAGQGYDTAGFVANTFYCNAWYGLDRGFAHYEDFYDNRVVSGLEVLRSATLGRWIVASAGIETETPGAKRSRKTAAMINRDALAWLSRRKDRPFFVFLNYYDAHAPFRPPDGFDRRYGLGAEPEAVRSSILRDYARLTAGRGPTGDPNAPAVIERAAELLRDSYDSCIAYLDDQLGRLFDELERRELLANTLVIVTSDHGEHFGDRNLFGHGHSLYRALLHIPLLIIPPSKPGMDLAEGRGVREPVSLRDLPATVVDLLGLQDRSPFPGRSLARYWASDPGTMPADPLLAEVEHQTCFSPSPHIPASLGPLQSLVADAHVYIRNSDGREELYDLEDDPSELHNLAGATDAPAVLERLRHNLRRLLLE
jgi:arylsulfatase A-like enzyme